MPAAPTHVHTEPALSLKTLSLFHLLAALSFAGREQVNGFAATSSVCVNGHTHSQVSA